MNNYYILLELHGNISGKIKDDLIWAGINEYRCSGVEEFSLSEKEVDLILHERAFVGGALSQDLIALIEQNVLENIHSVKFYFDGNNKEYFLSYKKYLDNLNYSLIYSHKEIEQEDWNTSWKSYFKPILISENIEIVPIWEKNDYVETKPISIFLNPGQGFGTGEHETTSLCLEVLDNMVDRPGEILEGLDFGCGSGVLGIAAIKKLNCTMDFCDIDHPSLDNCLENLRHNFHEKDLSSVTLISRERFNNDRKYNLIFANILYNVLLDERKMLTKKLQENGLLIVSGIIDDQVDRLVCSYETCEIKLLNVYNKNGWNCLLFKKEL